MTHAFYQKRGSDVPWLCIWDVGNPADWTIQQVRLNGYGIKYALDKSNAERVFIAEGGYNGDGQFTVGDALYEYKSVPVNFAKDAVLTPEQERLKWLGGGFEPIARAAA